MNLPDVIIAFFRTFERRERKPQRTPILILYTRYAKMRISLTSWLLLGLLGMSRLLPGTQLGKVEQRNVSRRKNHYYIHHDCICPFQQQCQDISNNLTSTSQSIQRVPGNPRNTHSLSSFGDDAVSPSNRSLFPVANKTWPNVPKRVGADFRSCPWHCKWTTRLWVSWRKQWGAFLKWQRTKQPFIYIFCSWYCMYRDTQVFLRIIPTSSWDQETQGKV